MSDDECFDIVRHSGRLGNYIPSGKQLPRTPTLTDVKKHLDFSDKDPTEEEWKAENSDNKGVLDFSSLEADMENISNPDELNSMLRGMKGYRLTAADFKFIQQLKEEQLIKKLQGELEELQKLLAREPTKGEVKKSRIQDLMRRLSILKTDLPQKEEASKPLERKAAVLAEKLQDTSNINKHTDSQTGVEDDRASETLRTSTEEESKPKPEAAAEKPTKPVKAARGRRKKVKEQESSSQEPVRAVRGRRKPAGGAQTTASQPKSPSKAEAGEAQPASQQAAPSRGKKTNAAAGEEMQNAGLRRSKRIASRK